MGGPSQRFPQQISHGSTSAQLLAPAKPGGVAGTSEAPEAAGRSLHARALGVPRGEPAFQETTAGGRFFLRVKGKRSFWGLVVFLDSRGHLFRVDSRL